jgi:serine/threonine-protein kinase
MTPRPKNAPPQAGTYSISFAARNARKAEQPFEKLVPGMLLEGKYQIREPIGEGGMGVVYEAEHLALGIVVAIKVLHPAEPGAPHVIERFKVEARSAASIRHPNLVEVTDYGLTPDNRPFFVMEHLSGESLAQRLASENQLSERATVEIADQILSGLATAHRKGVIHRDLKPENVFLARSDVLGETVKLLDFGVARIIGGQEPAPASNDNGRARTDTDGKPLTQRGIVLGTPGYLSPETAKGAPADNRSDLFSVGVILYEMIVGRAPFRGDSIEKIVSSTLHDPVLQPRAVRPDLSPPMERLILTALAKNPDDRFQHADEFLRQLSAAAVGRIPDNARACVTETTAPTPELLPLSALPLVPGDQEKIETLDSLQAAAPSDRSADPAQVKTPSPSPAAPWQDAAAASSVPPVRTASRRLPLLLISAAAVIALASLAAIAVSLGWFGDTPPGPASSPGSGAGLPGGSESPTDLSGATVTIWIEVVPLGATITWNNRLVKDRPLVVPRSDREVEMLISSPGYVPERLMIKPDRERTIRVSLRKI